LRHQTRAIPFQREAAIVPLFFFRMDDGGPAAGRLSLALPDPLAARREATRFAAEMLLDRPAALWQAQTWTVTVSDETGASLFIVTFEARDCSASADRPSDVGSLSRPRS
jgi:hypothetical protein